MPKIKDLHGSIPSDLTGKVFGSLTVLKRAENQGNYSAWKCRCECGTEVVVTTNALRRGRVKNCGCKKQEAHFCLDLTGKHIGLLTVIKKTDKRDSKGSVLWQCCCDCGNEVMYSADSLMHGNVKSCGCYREIEIRSKINDTLHRVEGTCIERLNLKKARSDNKCGHIGIHKISENRYQANIGLQGKRYYLGTFSTLDEAINARQRGEQMHLEFLEKYNNKKRLNSDAVITFEGINSKNIQFDKSLIVIMKMI